MEDADLPLADSYYSQWPRFPTVVLSADLLRIGYAFGEVFADQMRRVEAAAQRMGSGMQDFRRYYLDRFIAAVPVVQFQHPAILDPELWNAGISVDQWDACNVRTRALNARRNRNTGPRERRGIDGFHR